MEVQLIDVDYERDPAIYLNPDTCAISDSVTRIKCAFFGAPLTLADATNLGGYQADFHVVIAGSNTYTTSPQPLPCFGNPISLGAATINAPTSDGTYM